MDLDDVCDGLAAAANTIAGLHCYGEVPDSVNVPAFYVAEADINYDQTFGGMQDVTFVCRVLTSRADARLGQKALRPYLNNTGASSIKAALQGAPGEPQTLGGVCDDVHVRRARGPRVFEHNGVEYYGAEFTVRVIG